MTVMRPRSAQGRFPPGIPSVYAFRMQSRWIWLLVVAVVIGVIALAAKVAPGALDDNDRRMQLIYLCIILAVLTGGLAARLQARPGTVLAQLGTWGVIFAAAMPWRICSGVVRPAKSSYTAGNGSRSSFAYFSSPSRAFWRPWAFTCDRYRQMPFSRSTLSKL